MVVIEGLIHKLGPYNDRALTGLSAQSRVMFSAYQRNVRGESPYSSLSGASTTPVRQERPEVSLLLALDNIRKVLCAFAVATRSR